MRFFIGYKTSQCLSTHTHHALEKQSQIFETVL